VFQLVSQKWFQKPINDAEELAFVPALTAKGFINSPMPLAMQFARFLIVVRRTAPRSTVPPVPAVVVIISYHPMLWRSPIIGILPARSSLTKAVRLSSSLAQWSACLDDGSSSNRLR
jgi:hypothetical protein